MDYWQLIPALSQEATMNWRKLLASDAPSGVFIIRLLVAGVFLSEGIQKFLFPETLACAAPRYRSLHYPEWKDRTPGDYTRHYVDTNLRGKRMYSNVRFRVLGLATAALFIFQASARPQAKDTWEKLSFL